MGVQGAGRCVRGVHGAGGVCKDGAKGGCVQRAREACKRRARCWRGRSAAGVCKGTAEGGALRHAARARRARGVQGWARGRRVGGQSALVRVQGACRALSFGRGACKALTRRGSVVQRAVRRACNGRAKRSAALRVGGGGREGCIIPPSCRTWARVCPRVLGAVRGSSCKRRGPRANGGVLVQMEGSPCKWRGPCACVCAPVPSWPCKSPCPHRCPPPRPCPRARPRASRANPCPDVPPAAHACVCVCVCPPTCVLVAVQTVVSAHGRVLVQIAVSPSLSPRVPPCPCGRANRSAPP